MIPLRGRLFLCSKNRFWRVRASYLFDLNLYYNHNITILYTMAGMNKVEKQEYFERAIEQKVSESYQAELHQLKLARKGEMYLRVIRREELAWYKEVAKKNKLDIRFMDVAITVYGDYFPKGEYYSLYIKCFSWSRYREGMFDIPYVRKSHSRPKEIKRRKVVQMDKTITDPWGEVAKMLSRYNK